MASSTNIITNWFDDMDYLFVIEDRRYMLMLCNHNLILFSLIVILSSLRLYHPAQSLCDSHITTLRLEQTLTATSQCLRSYQRSHMFDEKLSATSQCVRRRFQACFREHKTVLGRGKRQVIEQ